jgi:hypothetical protein
VDWLKNNDRPSSLLVIYVLDQNAQELLGRTVDEEFREDALASEEAFRRFERRQEEERARGSRSEGGADGGGDSDRSQLWFRFSGYPYRLFGADGERFYYQIRAQRELFGIFNWPSAQISLLVIAAVAAALMALAMARYISRPIVRLQKASRALVIVREDSSGLLERNAVLSFVCNSLLLVPFEIHAETNLTARHVLLGPVRLARCHSWAK